MKTPQSPNAHAMAQAILSNLNPGPLKNADGTFPEPNKPHPSKATKAIKPLKDDAGSTTKGDKLNTLTHLLDSVDFNMNHAFNHVVDAKSQTEKVLHHLQQNPKLAKSYNSLHQRITKANETLKRFK